MKRLLLLSALLLLGTFAFGQDVSKQNERKRRIEEEISYIDNQLKAITGRQKATTDQLQLIRKRVANRKSLISDLDHRIAVINDSLTAKQREINRLQKELDTLETYSHKLIYNTYKNRDTKFWFMYILASDDLGQAFRRYGYLRDLSKQMNIQAQRIIETRDTLEKQTAALAEMKKEAESLRKERLSEVGKLQAEQNDSQKLVNQLKKDKKKYQQDLAKKQREVESLNREIQRIIQQALEDKGGKKGSGKTSSKPAKPIDYTLAKQFESNKGKLPWPAA